MTPMQELTAISQECCRLNEIESLLSWDLETQLPKNAVEGRAAQSEIITKYLHKIRTSPRMSQLLTQCQADIELSEDERALVDIMQWVYDRISKIPEAHSMLESRLTTLGMQAWVEARTTDDFSRFAPILTQLFTLTRERAELIGYTGHIYDALLEGHAQGMTVELVDREFEKLKKVLIPLIKSRMQQQKTSIIGSEFDVTMQKKFGKYLLQTIGYDFDRGGLGTVRHPFMTDLGPQDKRVANRYSASGFHSFFSALHEGGHALYEQGVAENYQQSDLSKHFSLAIHESQSRLYENIVGKSTEFWMGGPYQELQTHFPTQFKPLSLAQFIDHIHEVRPVMIRVDSDELTYDLHIIIRYEIEKMVLTGECEVADIPQIWNQKYAEYLGLVPQNLAEGCLQDVHWSIGAIGYFPTYTLGNINASQIWHTFVQSHPTWRADFAAGNTTILREWLQTNIHQYGSSVHPVALLKRLCNEELNSDYYIQRLTERYL